MRPPVGLCYECLDSCLWSIDHPRVESEVEHAEHRREHRPGQHHRHPGHPRHQHTSEISPGTQDVKNQNPRTTWNFRAGHCNATIFLHRLCFICLPVSLCWQQPSKLKKYLTTTLSIVFSQLTGLEYSVQSVQICTGHRCSLYA